MALLHGVGLARPGNPYEWLVANGYLTDIRVGVGTGPAFDGALGGPGRDEFLTLWKSYYGSDFMVFPAGSMNAEHQNRWSATLRTMHELGRYDPARQYDGEPTWADLTQAMYLQGGGRLFHAEGVAKNWPGYTEAFPEVVEHGGWIEHEGVRQGIPPAPNDYEGLFEVGERHDPSKPAWQAAYASPVHHGKHWYYMKRAESKSPIPIPAPSPSSEAAATALTNARKEAEALRVYQAKALEAAAGVRRMLPDPGKGGAPLQRLAGEVRKLLAILDPEGSK